MDCGGVISVSVMGDECYMKPEPEALISILPANITQPWEQRSAVPLVTLLRGFSDDIFDL